MVGRRRRRRKQLLDDVKETRGYWKVKEEAPGRTVWGNRFGRGCGSAVVQGETIMKQNHSFILEKLLQCIMMG